MWDVQSAMAESGRIGITEKRQSHLRLHFPAKETLLQALVHKIRPHW
jgi:hypothetical protein